MTHDNIVRAIPFGDVAWLVDTFCLSFSSLGWHLGAINVNTGTRQLWNWALFTVVAFAWPILRVYVL